MCNLTYTRIKHCNQMNLKMNIESNKSDMANIVFVPIENYQEGQAISVDRISACDVEKTSVRRLFVLSYTLVLFTQKAS